ncbi:MAG: hypothetical protein ABEJ72_05150 [Candidatus Aenigmatarchaeota archaeon]
MKEEAEEDLEMLMGAKREKMDEDFPSHREKIDEALTGPFLLLDDMNFASFNGRKESNKIKYDSTKTNLTRIKDKDLMDALEKGDKVVEKEGVDIYQEGELIESTEKGTIIQFQKPG